MRLGKTENEEIQDTKARPRGPKIARKDLEPNWQLRDGLNSKKSPGRNSTNTEERNGGMR